MGLADAIPTVLERIAREDGDSPGAWEDARATALAGLKDALLTEWQEDAGDERLMDGLAIGTIMAYGTACDAYDSQQMTLQAYLGFRERAMRVIALREGGHALALDAAHKFS